MRGLESSDAVGGSIGFTLHAGVSSSAVAVRGSVSLSEQDQYEWDRCLSFRRLFLGLQDAGADLDPVLKKFVYLLRKHGSRAAARRVEELVVEGELYEALELVTRSFANGEQIVCMVLRARFPDAPDGFEKLGDMVGKPKLPPDKSPRVWPNRLFGRLFNDG